MSSRKAEILEDDEFLIEKCINCNNYGSLGNFCNYCEDQGFIFEFLDVDEGKKLKKMREKERKNQKERKKNK